MDNEENIVKKEFDFGWLSKIDRDAAELAFKHAGKSILDVGCGTCQLYNYLKNRGWKGTYYGIDVKRYEGFNYMKEINLIIGDAFEIEFPKVDTVILYNILEHIDKPKTLLKKALDAAIKNVLINVPKRNEDMWKYGIIEYHQLDKTHKHCGFSKEEVYKLVDLAGGGIVRYQEKAGISVLPFVLFGKKVGALVLSSKIGRYIPFAKTFYTEIWCEIMR